MVREETKRQKCSIAGKRGGGNPSLTYKGEYKGQSKGGPEDEDEDETEIEYPQNLRAPEFKKVWDEWLEYRAVEKKKPVSKGMARVQLRQMSRIGPHRAVRQMEHTMANGWQGLREPDSPPQQLRANAYAATKVNAERAAQSSREMSLAFRDAAVPQPEVQAVPKKDDGSAEKARQIRELSRG
jgi:hypothetical protein